MVSQAQRYYFIAFCLFAACIVLSNAWVTEDAYINFRVIDNFINGYGLRWNVDERVQVYTSPLWLLLQIPLNVIFDNVYLVCVALSAICAALAVALLCRAIPASAVTQAVFVILLFTLSRTLREFAICGLENPLHLLLLSAFIFEVFRTDSPRLERLCFIAGVLFLVRMDAILLISPFMLAVTWQQRSRIQVSRVLLALSPAIAWMVFCLIYYGFVFPNTKYAKLNTGIALTDYITQGGHYFSNFFYYDTVGFALIVAAFVRVAGLLLNVQAFQPVPRVVAHKLALLLAGCVIQLLYILFIGGDFMAGRYFTAVIFVSIATLFVSSHFLANQRQCIGFATIMVIFSYLASQVLYPGIGDNVIISAHHGIVNERRFYESSNGLFTDSQKLLRREPRNWMVKIGEKYRNKADEMNTRSNDPYELQLVESAQAIGLIGYYAGPNVILIDHMALADPFLARHPVKNVKQWRIGHFKRRIPRGYILARRSGELNRLSPQDRVLYRDIRLITSGPIFDAERLKKIAGF